MSTAPHGFLRVGAACPRVWVADPERNAEEILRLVEEARVQGTQLLVFPELGLTGYTAGDLFFSLTTLVGGAERALARLLQATAGHRMTIAVGLPVALDGKLFNCAVAIYRGNPSVHNWCCYGVFAIYFEMGKSWLADLGVTSAQQLYDARTNITAAYHLYTLAGWQPWSQTDPG